jgi:hypothetical protein
MLKHAAAASIMACLVIAFACANPATGAEQFAVGATNIALAANGGHVVAFSSHVTDANGKPVKQWEIGNVIDGQHVSGTDRPADSYGWSSAQPPQPGNPQWFVLGFKDEKTKLVTRVVLDPVTDDPPEIGRWAQDFKVLISNTTKDGPWVEVKSGRLLNKPIKQTFDFPPVECRYMKVQILSNWFSDQFVELGEIEVYEALATGDTLDQLIIRLENLLNDLKRYRDSQRYNQPLRPELGTTTTPATPAATATPTQ